MPWKNLRKTNIHFSKLEKLFEHTGKIAKQLDGCGRPGAIFGFQWMNSAGAGPQTEFISLEKLTRNICKWKTTFSDQQR